MKRMDASWIGKLTVVAAAMVVASMAYAAPSAATDRAQYRYVELGISGEARAINDHRQVVGTYGIYGQGFLWDRGRMTDLGSLSTRPDVLETVPMDINNRGQIVGYSYVGGGFHAFLWEHGTLTDLGTLGGPFSKAVRINDRGQILGWAQDAAGLMHSVLWQDGAMTEHQGCADINNRGQTVCGESLWYRGRETTLTFSATAINNAGWVVGYGGGDEYEPARAYLWRRGVTTDLGDLGRGGAVAIDVNDRGEVLGVAYGPGGPDAVFLWSRGVMTDLGLELPDRRSPDSEMFRLNNRGDIVATPYGLDDPSAAVYLRQ